MPQDSATATAEAPRDSRLTVDQLSLLVIALGLAADQIDTQSFALAKFMAGAGMYGSPLAPRPSLTTVLTLATAELKAYAQDHRELAKKLLEAAEIRVVKAGGAA